MDIEEFFTLHNRVVLELSDGKDSAACLYLLQPYWDRMMVVWCNSGNPYPETVEYMKQMKAMLPYFVEVSGDQIHWIEEHGYPVDFLPIFDQDAEIKLSSCADCCTANRWMPLHTFITYFQFTGVIRGQKACDKLKAPIQSGHVENGIQYFFPLENWSDEDVIQYLGDRLPASYSRGLKSGLDCLNCTAYAAGNEGRIADLDSIDAEAASEVRRVHGYLKSQLIAHVSYLE